MGLLEFCKDGRDGIIHIHSHIVRINSSKTGCVEVNQEIEFLDDLCKQIVVEDGGRETSLGSGKVPIQVFAITKFSTKTKVSRYIYTWDCY